jgi:hypothetical protein
VVVFEFIKHFFCFYYGLTFILDEMTNMTYTCKITMNKNEFHSICVCDYMQDYDEKITTIHSSIDEKAVFPILPSMHL